jgi:type I restriction enzyme S subunit
MVETVTLADIAEIWGGYAFKSADLEPQGYPVVKIAEITPPRINIDACECVSPAKVVALDRFRLWDGDILMAMTGATTGKAGRLSYSNPAYLNQRVAKLKAKAGGDVDDFVWAVISQPNFDKVVLANAHGSAQPNISADGIGRVPVPKLSREDQVRIGRVARSLDDKIEQNRRVGCKLDQLARAVFKAWFVDFEPVKAKAAGATGFPVMPSGVFASLPTRLIDSTIGPMPNGWAITNFQHLASFVLGGDWGTDSPGADNPDPACCIRGADIPDLWANGFGKMPVRYLKRPSLEKRSLKPSDIVVEISGGSPTQSTGRPVLVSSELLAQLPHPLVCSNFCRTFRPLDHHSNYAYFMLRAMYATDQFLQYENGTTGIKNFAFTKFCEIHPVALPPLMILQAFDETVKPLLALMAAGGTESRRLAAVRDYLLPRLLSGRVRATGSKNATSA